MSIGHKPLEVSTGKGLSKFTCNQEVEERRNLLLFNMAAWMERAAGTWPRASGSSFRDHFRHSFVATPSFKSETCSRLYGKGQGRGPGRVGPSVHPMGQSCIHFSCMPGWQHWSGVAVMVKDTYERPVLFVISLIGPRAQLALLCLKACSASLPVVQLVQ